MSKITMLTVKRLPDVPIGDQMQMHPVVIEDDNEMILVDCGDPRLMPAVINNMKENGIDPDKLTRIIITHHDYDHMGALAEFVDAFPNVTVCASPVQAKYIQGESRGMRLQEEDWEYVSKSPEEKSKMFRLRVLMDAHFVPAKVNYLLHNGDVLPWCGGLEIIYTEGHMPGHISVYSREHKALISGDAVSVNDDGKLFVHHVMEMARQMAIPALDRLMAYDIKTVYAFHGGTCTEEIHQQLAALRTEELEYLSVAVL